MMEEQDLTHLSDQEIDSIFKVFKNSEDIDKLDIKKAGKISSNVSI